MRAVLVGAVVAVVAAMLPCPVRTQEPQKIDPNRKAGVYAEAGKRIVELTLYADAVDKTTGPALASSSPGVLPSTAPTLATQQARVPFADVPHLPDLSAFLINMPGSDSQYVLNMAAMVFIVGDGKAGRPAPVHHQMTCKVRLAGGVALYRVVSPQLDRSWLRKTYERDVAQRGEPGEAAFLALMVPAHNGIATRVYSVQIFPE